MSDELSHQFEDLSQQRESATLGMWAFLATEVLFFGGLFLLYTVYRLKFPETFVECSKLMNLKLGTLNTGALLTSSLTMAFAVNEAEEGRSKRIVFWLIVTELLGLLFLGVKAIEYAAKFREHLIPGINFRFDGRNPYAAQIFFSLYFAMTGLHALHMVVGVGLLTVMAVLAEKGRFTKTYSNPVMISGLYWHFVDIVWIFLFPMLYLIGNR
ncbi:MAG TPA: cytochrome c oxidase subunit 3 family protein [Elusimicrobiota bacterium]|nr:cytochrome c oxidase subunit 3 family protein [Elusimicrobiota bacterium]